MFYPSCTCQGTVVDLFNGECNTKKQNKTRTLGWKCEFTDDANLQVSTEAGTSNNMKN